MEILVEPKRSRVRNRTHFHICTPGHGQAYRCRARCQTSENRTCPKCRKVNQSLQKIQAAIRPTRNYYQDRNLVEAHREASVILGEVQRLIRVIESTLAFQEEVDV